MANHSVNTVSEHLAERLEQLLAELLASNETLLDLTREHRSALSRADGAAVEACSKRHAEIAGRIGALEGKRRELIRAIAPETPSATINSITERLAEPVRSRVVEAAAKLRAVLVRVQQELRVLRAATVSLVGHMEGLMQQVARVLNTAGTYGRQGRIESGAAAPSGLDLSY